MDNYFQVQQNFTVVNVVDISTINHRAQQYLAVSSGLVQNAVHQGKIYIYKYEKLR